MINAFTNAAQKLGPRQRDRYGTLRGDVAGSSFAIVLFFSPRQAKRLSFSFPTANPELFSLIAS
jgi:hypothetical protein